MATSYDNTRAAAVALIYAVQVDKYLIAELLGEEGPLAGLAPSEKARAQRLALTTLRNQGRADAVLKPLLRKPPPPLIHAVLRLGVVEILQETAAPYGVVNAMVEIIRADPSTKSLSGLVNAILRKVPDISADSWRALPAQKMPGWLRGRLDSAYGRKVVEGLEAVHQAGAPLDLTPKADVSDALVKDLGAEVLPTGSIRLQGNVQVSALPGFAEGSWWVQDAAAALPARLLNARPGEEVLDLCAAPGGKTMQLCDAGANVTALDSSPARLERLKENLKRTGLKANVVAADALTWQGDAAFDAILLDAPCSATGTIRRHPDLPFAKSGADIKPLFALQRDILDHALTLLKPGGRLVFCTCSLLPEEGEQQVKAVLERHAGLKVVAPDQPWIASEWRDDLGGLRIRPDMWLDQGGIDGFYMALLRKTAEA